MNYDSLLRVVNNSSTDSYMFAHNSQRWVVFPGKQQFLPIEAVIRSLGDPRSGPQPLRIIPEGGGNAIIVPSRQDEIKRLSVLYGTYSDGVDSIDKETGKSLKSSIPNVTVYNMGDGEDEPIVFPVDDPFCSQFTPIDTDLSTIAVMQRQLEKMRRQIMSMEAQKKGSGSPSTPPLVSDSPEVDEDSPIPVSSPRQVRRPA